jgi:hypothetical protein
VRRAFSSSTWGALWFAQEPNAILVTTAVALKGAPREGTARRRTRRGASLELAIGASEVASLEVESRGKMARGRRRGGDIPIPKPNFNFDFFVSRESTDPFLVIRVAW